MTSEHLPALEIPTKWRSFVYLIGMLGFPVVIATYVLVVLSADLKQVDKSINSLANRIDERPMGIEKSTDFVVYISDALRSDLQAGFSTLVSSLSFTSTNDKKSLAKTVSIIQRETEGYIRPIVRKHQRFAARFPTEGGNLGSLFRLSSFSEDIEAGETEAHLRGKATKELSEALAAMLINNIAQFGRLDALKSDEEDELRAQIRKLFDPSAQEETGSDGENSTPSVAPESGKDALTQIEIIDPQLFLRLSLDSIETATTVLRDQMLQDLRLNSTRLER